MTLALAGVTFISILTLTGCSDRAVLSGPQLDSGSQFDQTQTLLDLGADRDGGPDLELPRYLTPPEFVSRTLSQPQLGPMKVVVGDFNGDKKPDIALANHSGSVTVLLGRGDGSFLSFSQSPFGHPLSDMVASDLNRDGRLDLAVMNFDDSIVGVLLSRGDGTFEPATSLMVGAIPVGIVAIDVNADGNPDLVTASLSGTMSVLLGKGDGSFVAAANTSVGIPLSSIDAIVGKIGGEMDLVVTDGAAARILFGKGDGTFGSSLAYGAGKTAMRATSLDMDEDGLPDLVVVDSGTNPDGTGSGVSVLLAYGDGLFRSSVFYPAGKGSIAMASGDLNGDHHLDVLVVNEGSHDVSLLLGRGDGTLQLAAMNYPVGRGWLSIAVGDFNLDGKTDFVTVNPDDSTLSLFLNK